jgi:hypothetical protein
MQLALGDRQAILKSRFSEADFRDNMVSAVGDYVTKGSNGELIEEPVPLRNRDVSRKRIRWILSATLLWVPSTTLPQMTGYSASPALPT